MVDTTEQSCQKYIQLFQHNLRSSSLFLAIQIQQNHEVTKKPPCPLSKMLLLPLTNPEFFQAMVALSATTTTTSTTITTSTTTTTTTIRTQTRWETRWWRTRPWRPGASGHCTPAAAPTATAKPRVAVASAPQAVSEKEPQSCQYSSRGTVSTGTIGVIYPWVVVECRLKEGHPRNTFVLKTHQADFCWVSVRVSYLHTYNTRMETPKLAWCGFFLTRIGLLQEANLELVNTTSGSALCQDLVLFCRCTAVYVPWRLQHLFVWERTADWSPNQILLSLQRTGKHRHLQRFGTICLLRTHKKIFPEKWTCCHAHARKLMVSSDWVLYLRRVTWK